MNKNDKRKVSNAIIQLSESKGLNVIMFTIAVTMLTICMIDGKFNIGILKMDSEKAFGMISLYLVICGISLFSIMKSDKDKQEDY